MELVNIDKHIRKWAKVAHDFGEERQEGKGQKTRMDVVYDMVKVKVVDQKETDKTNSEDSETPDTSSHDPQVVFESSYKNNTSVPQQHQFEMSRETSATVTSSLTKGFTRSGHVGITLTVPDTLTNVTGGFGPEVEIKQADDSKVHHSLTWKVNSTVNVPPGQTTVAKLVIKETEKKFHFTAEVNLRGTILVRHVDLTTGEFISVVQSDIAALLEDIRDKQTGEAIVEDNSYDDLPAIPGDVRFENGRVIWPVEGNLHFRFGISQDVVVQPKTLQTRGNPSDVQGYK